MPSHRISPGVYDVVYDTFLTMPEHLVLGRANYGTHFIRQPGSGIAWDYKDPTSNRLYETILVGEIRPALCGTRFSARGTHYMGQANNPILIDDKTRVKSLFVLGKPDDCTKEFGMLFDNQLATLCDVIEQEREEVRSNKSFAVKEWTSQAGSDANAPPEYINVVTDAMYGVPKGGETITVPPCKKHALTQRTISESEKVVVSDKGKGRRGRSSKASDAPNHIADVVMDDDATDHPQIVNDGSAPISGNVVSQTNRTTKDLYPPSILYDYGGDLFKHASAKLKQLDIRDEHDALIPPDKWYDALRQGTLVMVRTTMQAFNYESRRVYQLNAHTIKVLDRSNLEVEPRKQTTLEIASAGPSASSDAAKAMTALQLGKRARDEES